VSRARHRREGAPRPDDPRGRLVTAIAIARVAWVVGTPHVRCIIPSTLVSRAFGHAQKQSSACPWKLPGSRTANTRKLGPWKLSEGAQDWTRVLGRSRPSRATRHPAGGLPPPQELAAGFERDQVSVKGTETSDRARDQVLLRVRSTCSTSVATTENADCPIGQTPLFSTVSGRTAPHGPYLDGVPIPRISG
jgi:hypothetical protein